MNAKLAFRWVLLSLIMCALFLGAAVILRGRLLALQSAQNANVPPIQRQLDSMAMVLDANGTGTQVFGNTQLVVNVKPYPVIAQQPVTLTVVGATHAPTAQAQAISPTLFVTLESEGSTASELLQVDFRADGRGGYTAYGAFFPFKATWRTRVHFYLNEADSSDVLLRIDAQ